MRNKHKARHKLRSNEKKPSVQRNRTLDSLRGLAILLMIVDHVAGVFFSVKIEPDTLRFLTRLSMPLFAILMGFFLSAATQTHWKRLVQLAAASAAMNGLYYYVYEELEILASLLVCYIGFLALGRHFVWCFVAAYFFLQDPSRYLFDYSLSVVATCVAQGVILQRFGWRIASVTGLLILPAAWFVTPPTQYALFFILPASWLVGWGHASPKLAVPGLETLGRYPLTAYLIQYFIILGWKALFLM